MNFQEADALSLSLFLLLAFVLFLLSLWSLRRAKVHPAYSVGFIVYLILFSGIVALGIPVNFPLPTVPLLFASVLGGAIFIALSDAGKKLSQHYSLAALIGLQAFRLPLELILHQWAAIDTIPSTMTWTGQNWDVVTGVVSLLSIPLVNKNRKLAWVVQITGFVLLLNVLRVVMMSSGFPFSWELETPLQLIMYFPYCLIGPLMVGLAFAGHLITFRALARRRSSPL